MKVQTVRVDLTGNAVTTNDGVMRAWVGCLACYNEGRLTGAWVAGIEAGDYVPCTRPGHEEWWVFDHEGYAGLIAGECSPDEAQRVAEWWDEVAESVDYLPDHEHALRAWLDNHYAGGVDTSDLPSCDGFTDSYCGVWEGNDPRDAIGRVLWQDMTDGDGYPIWHDTKHDEVRRLPEPWSTYVDWDGMARDAELSGWWAVRTPDDADNYGYMVFRGEW